ncbi:GNAT family N-acetyltransferase [Staphylococcus massiliensis CCUG 55927]|uniref:GNAT family N-acetyltransferase n=1 Tax=Staphylococcus massiliensis TaxID=555791 RepID=UPI00031808F8|nr:GNAT family N-acetyltransferase [Staphylococcus massiliensis]PNZ98576.1 GNAT family N-acetyltransferase [Staphylococcus massiliensis CCUG 55927]
MIRQATLNDVSNIARIHVETWKDTYCGLIDQSYLDAMSTKDKESLWEQVIPKSHVYVATDNNDNVVGFINGGINRDNPQQTHIAEVYAFYVLPSSQDKGYGRALLKQLFNCFIEDGYQEVIIYVLSENPTTQFYENMGGIWHHEHSDTIGTTKVKETCYRFKLSHI